MHKFPSFEILVIALVAAWAPAQDAAWKPLFDGRSLDGWVQRGGKAVYRVEEGCIVGETRPRTPNSFLCTSRDHADFELEFEVLVDSRLNSGVQIRSRSIPSYRKGRVHGYQVEIDPSPRAWSAGIYDEARRGWLNDLAKNESARKAFKKDEWNHYRVLAVGDSLRTWINGVPAADLRDAMTLSGFIGLQVHSTRSEKPLQVKWRKLRIRDLGAHAWRPLLDASGLDGWRARNGGTWRMDGEALVGRRDAVKAHGLLMTEQVYDDFTIRFDFKTVKGNSGFYFRVDEVAGGVGCHGFQAELEPDFSTGGLYETGGRGWVVKPPEGIKKWYKPGEWATMTVSAHGERVVVTVNGRKTADLVDPKGRRRGKLAFQLHGGEEMHLELRNVELLDATEARPERDRR